MMIQDGTDSKLNYYIASKIKLEIDYILKKRELEVLIDHESQRLESKKQWFSSTALN